MNNIEEIVPKLGFKTLHIHDVQAVLKNKGFERGPYKILEVCRAPVAHEVLSIDPKAGLFLPCRIAVYEEGGKVKIGTILPDAMRQFFNNDELDKVICQMESLLKKMVDAGV
ncbi:DUF302 domain-containing protein [bacterium]|nr:DUF302 domain-containing protein [FCB group bacterium]MBL7190761.1 DUF302 domain-containing protein [bacterium]